MADLWSRIMKAIRNRVPEGNFSTWFAPIKPVSVHGHRVLVQVPNPLFKEWIEKHYGGLFEEVGRDLGIPDLAVELSDGATPDLVLTPPAQPKGKPGAAARKAGAPSEPR